MQNSILIVGMNIGKVYGEELSKRNWKVDYVDIDSKKEPTFLSLEQVKSKNQYDAAIICTPNYLHEEHMEYCAKNLVKGFGYIFYEKPGIKNIINVNHMKFKYHCNFVMTKNNLFRPQLVGLRDLIYTQQKLISDISINWTNKNRIPFPGHWFTNKEKAFGGVSRDLLPHLLHFMCGIVERSKLSLKDHKKVSNFNMNTITSTDYGEINNINPVYDVDDSCYMIFKYSNNNTFDIKLNASWKTLDGSEERNITINYKDGTKFVFEFGLCPAIYYGDMIEQIYNRQIDDKFLSELDNFVGYCMEII
jgi:predicted dehydrogenase